MHRGGSFGARFAAPVALGAGASLCIQPVQHCAQHRSGSTKGGWFVFGHPFNLPIFATIKVPAIHCHSDGAPDEQAYKGMLHADVLEYVASEHGDLVEQLVELARLQVIELGESERALRTIDAAIAVTPKEKRGSLQERLWMEGLACFYTGKWERGARHFEAEISVNGADVEVPVWRWLCDAYNPQVGVKRACARLLECEHDVRAPFPEIWRMYKGATGSVEDRIADVLTVAAKARERSGGLGGSGGDSWMWGNFYVGLYLEALGRHEEARRYFVAACESGSFNNISKLARTHFLQLQRREAQETWAKLAQQVHPFLSRRGCTA